MQFGFCMHSQFHNTLKYWERSEIKTLFLWHIWILAFSLCVYNESCWYHLGTMELQLTKVPKGFEWDEIRTALRLIIKGKYLYSVFQKTHKTGTCNRTEHQQNALHYLHIQFRQANFIRTQFVTKVNYYSSQNTLKVFLCVCVCCDDGGRCIVVFRPCLVTTIVDVELLLLFVICVFHS